MLTDTESNTTTRAGTFLRELLSSPSAGAVRRNVAAGSTLFAAVDAAEKVFVIESGQVRIYQTSEGRDGRLIEVLGPNDWCGAAALASQSTYGTLAVAVTATIVWEISAAALLEMLESQPKVAVELLRQVALKLQDATESASELVFDDCNGRLLKTLVRFSRSSAATMAPDGVVLRMTHEQLAQAVGAARETISLALTQLRHRNLVKTGRNQLSFDPKALTRFADACRPGSANHVEPGEPVALRA